MRSRQRIWILAVLATAACDAAPSEPTAPFLGVNAELYLNFALDIMEANSIRKYEIDWESFRAQARTDAENAAAVDPADTYPAIEAALERIGDNHSFFRPPQGPAPAAGAEPAASAPLRADPAADLVAPGVGYVDVPPYSGGGTAGDSLATEYHRLIEAVDTLGTSCRWVVDLRGNTGGNMWPMLAGVGPVLGAADTAGFFVDADSVVTSWFYDAGQAGTGDTLVIAQVDSVYELDFPDPYVAVLTDGETASSGEAIAVAFRGRAGARSFGAATWGVSTANAAFGMPDGAVIFLTVATMADRLGTLYGGKIVPDESVSGTKTGEPGTDAVLDAALTWLNAQSCT
jgi:hypothetical protein